MQWHKINLLHRYLLRNFFGTLLIVILAASSLFLVIDFLEKVHVFIKQGSSLLDILAYLFFRLPLIIQRVTPIAVLIATLISISQLSRLSEITAMRACGASIIWLAKPLIIVGLLISVVMFIAGETIVPAATQRMQSVYYINIKKKVQSGSFDRDNFWFRSGRRFYNVALYVSVDNALKGISTFDLNDSRFEISRRIDAAEANWEGPQAGWVMKQVVETVFLKNGNIKHSTFKALPLIIDKNPSDFYNFKRSQEATSYTDLKKSIKKLQKEGVPVTKLKVDLASKLAFPLVNMIAVIIAFPFSLLTFRSSGLSKNFILGVSSGFAYYFIHAFATSFGAAEVIPPTLSAWTANVIMGCLGGYLLAGAEG